MNGDVRLALIRIGVVLGKDGGALGTIVLLILLLNFLHHHQQVRFNDTIIRGDIPSSLYMMLSLFVSA